MAYWNRKKLFAIIIFIIYYFIDLLLLLLLLSLLSLLLLLLLFGQIFLTFQKRLHHRHKKLAFQYLKKKPTQNERKEYVLWENYYFL